MNKIIKLRQEDIPNYIQLGIKEAPCVLYGIHDKSFVWVCNEEQCDWEYIRINNIPHIQIDGKGSTIVCSKGDINFGFFGNREFCEEMFQKLSNLVSQKITNFRFLNNDFMYNGNKHGSATNIDFGDVYYIGVHLSNNIDKLNDIESKVQDCYATCKSIFRHDEQESARQNPKQYYADDLKKENFILPEPLVNYKNNDFHRFYICEIEKVFIKD